MKQLPVPLFLLHLVKRKQFYEGNTQCMSNRIQCCNGSAVRTVLNLADVILFKSCLKRKIGLG